MIAILRGAGFALRTAVQDVSRRPLFSLLSIAAMGAAAFVLGGFLMLSSGARSVYARLAAQTVIEVYLRPDADPEAVADLERTLGRFPEVARIERVSPEAALAELGRLYPDMRDVDTLLGGNPLPASLRVVPRVPDPAALSGVMRAARGHAAALSVRYDREWLQVLARAGEGLRLAALGGSTLLILAGLVTIGSVVRLALDDKLEEVRLLRLAGAPISFVLAPVLLSGALLGGAGATLSLAALEGARAWVSGWSSGTPLDALVATAVSGGLPLATALTLVGLAAAAGALSAGFAAGRAAVSA
jgi:cell division transport system permease protein